jgi:hypothetical protein
MAPLRAHTDCAAGASSLELVEVGAAGPPEPEWLAALGARYGLEFDFESVPVLCERFGVTFGPGN